jgi:hypothetical protein
MKKFAKICGVAVARALLNGLIALTLMLVVEFSISGNLEAYPLYAGASALITLAFFIYQLLVARRRLGQPSQAGNH